jgi:hypothetical protein
MANIPSGSRFIVAAGGDADVVLAKHRRENRMTPLLRLTGSTGIRYTVELSTSDVIALYECLPIMFDADQDRVTQWWRTLNGADGPR